ncbi:sulfotransferase [Phytohabitans rumicis]|uniref:Sulfotransferase n=2 Tax=Phytohabitans rumicis TaxID=1076125 RepID=A0A6V8LD86_9ACTN|nr:sulfotransferase [Phytohabitans rumicis]
MLHAHARIAIPPETRFVLEAYRARRAFGDLRESGARRALARWIVDRPETRFADLGLSAEETIEEITAGPPTLGSALAIPLQGYAQRFGKSRWGDKRPAYVTNLPALARLFPDALFVHVIRDGRDCVASLKQMPWHRTGIYQAISAWAQAVDHGRWAARVLGPGAYHEIRYERLVTNVGPELAALCRFLHEEYDPAMTDPAALATLAVPDRKSWHARTRSAIGPDRIGRWRSILEPWEAGLCEAVLGGRLRSLGYPLTGAPPPPAVHRLRYERVAARHRLAPLRRLAIRGHDRLPLTTPLAYRPCD